MAKAVIEAGICGFVTTVEAAFDGEKVSLQIQSDCPAIMKLGEHLPSVDPYREVSSRRAIPKTLQAGLDHCTHAACPVPVGIIKAVEVAAGLALPKDAVIRVSNE